MDDEVPIDKSKIVVDITGIRQMLEEWSPDQPSPKLVEQTLQMYRGYERGDYGDKLETELRRRTGIPRFDNGTPNPLTPDEEEKLRGQLDTMTYKTTEATVRAQIKSEFERYFNAPEPLSQAKQDTKEHLALGEYIGRAKTLVATLDDGGGISPQDVTFLKEFSSRAEGWNSDRRDLLLPPGFSHLKDDPSSLSPIYMQWDRKEDGVPSVNRFEALQQKMRDYEYLLSDMKKAALREGRDPNALRLPQFTLPTTEKAVLNYVTHADWGHASDVRLSYFIGEAPASTLLPAPGMATIVERPYGLISDKPLFNVAKAENGLESLALTKLPNPPRITFMMGMMLPNQPGPERYRMTVSRDTYDSVLSPVTDFSLSHLKMGRQNARVLGSNFLDKSDKDNVCHLCTLTDAQAKTVQPRLDALKIPYDAERGLTHLTLPRDVYTRQDLKPVIDSIKQLLPSERPDGNDMILNSRDALTPEQQKQLTEALMLLPKKDVAMTQETYLVFKPEAYETQVLPVLGRIEMRQLGDRYSDQVRSAVTDAIRHLVNPPKKETPAAEAPKLASPAKLAVPAR